MNIKGPFESEYSTAKPSFCSRMRRGCSPSRSNFFLVMLVFLMAGCATHPTTTYYVPMNGPFKSLSLTPGEIAGRYYCDGGPGYAISLTLNANHTYAAAWSGCLIGLGPYGEANGSWRLLGKAILFSPSEESGMMKGHLRKLTSARQESSGRLVLLFAEVSPFYFEKREPQEPVGGRYAK